MMRGPGQRLIQLFIYRCENCGNIKGTTTESRPPNGFMDCPVCYNLNREREPTLHEAVAYDPTTNQFLLLTK